LQDENNNRGQQENLLENRQLITPGGVTTPMDLNTLQNFNEQNKVKTSCLEV